MVFSALFACGSVGDSTGEVASGEKSDAAEDGKMFGDIAATMPRQ